jgi:hypothetical protein
MVLRSGAPDAICWRPAVPAPLVIIASFAGGIWPRSSSLQFEFAACQGVHISILRGKNPVAAGLQADDIACLQSPVAGRIDLDDGLALITA